MQLAMKLCGDMLRLGATVMRQRLGKMKGAGIRNVRELWPNPQRAQKIVASKTRVVRSKPDLSTSSQNANRGEQVARGAFDGVRSCDGCVLNSTTQRTTATPLRLIESTWLKSDTGAEGLFLMNSTFMDTSNRPE